MLLVSGKRIQARPWPASKFSGFPGRCPAMKVVALLALLTILTAASVLSAQEAAVFSCPAGTADVMKYFAMAKPTRSSRFMRGSANSIYTEVFPDEDFAEKGYWFWLKSPAGHGFDVKTFDRDRVYMRATELTWTDNSSFKRFVTDLPIAERCVPEGKPGAEIKVADTKFNYYASCKAYKSSHLGTAVNTLDAPAMMDMGGNIGQRWTRVLHYRYNCDRNFANCADEEQFYLANGFGLWQWKHFRNGSLVKTSLINHLADGKASGSLPCPDTYR